MSKLQISAGSLEGFLYGFSLDEISCEKTNPTNQKLSNLYGYRTHNGYVKCLSISDDGKLLVTGGVDELIKIYNLERNKEVGDLQQHSGAVTSLKFVKNSHLLSGSEDRTICIWRVSNWTLMHVLGGHKGTVNCISVHPSNKLAMSISSDRTLRLWNLIEGRIAYIKRLQGCGEIVKWSEQGNYFAAVVNDNLIIFDASSNENPTNVKFPTKISCMCWLSDFALVAVFKNTHLKILKFNGENLATEDISNVCGQRIREILFCKSGDANFFVASTSDGKILVWKVFIELLSKEKFERFDQIFTLIAVNIVQGQPRFTCLEAHFYKKSENVISSAKVENEEKEKNEPIKSESRKNNEKLKKEKMNGKNEKKVFANKKNKLAVKRQKRK